MYIEINNNATNFKVGKVYNIKNKNIKMYNNFCDIENNDTDCKCYFRIKYLKNNNKILIKKKLNIKDFLDLKVNSIFLINYIKSQLITQKHNKIKLEDFDKIIPYIIQHDTSGQACFELASLSPIYGFSIDQLTQAVIDKDKTGEWCSKIAVISSDIKLLEKSTLKKLKREIIKKDTFGFWIKHFNKMIENIKEGYCEY